jgi:uncharacterized membrane protein YgdD (TMEM256/DUF423 family)
MNKSILATATGLMAVAIVLGALAGHALEAVLTSDQITSFQTGVRYQAWHCLAIIAIQLFPENVVKTGIKNKVSLLMLLGILFFSFSIYLLSLKDVIGIGSAASILGPITPIGGLLFIAGWVWLTVSIIKR